MLRRVPLAIAPPTTIYTLGHSRHPLARFVELLSQHEITTLVDVRSHPYSRWSSHFTKAPLSHALASAGFDYVYLGRELGGRPEGGTDDAARALAPEFLGGIEQLVALAARARVAILCAEEDPSSCHRRRLVTPALLQRDVGVRHIRGDGRVQTEEEIARADQLGLFG
jgi:uncharacterized protein (DUF488 family)